MSGHGQTVLQFPGEIDVLDQNTFDFDAPSRSDFGDDFLDALSDFLASLNDVLQDAGTEDVTERGLRTFHKSSADGTNTKGRLVRVDNVEVDDRRDVHVDIVFGHTHLRRDFDDRDFDVDLLQFLTQSGKYQVRALDRGQYGLT